MELECLAERYLALEADAASGAYSMAIGKRIKGLEKYARWQAEYLEFDQLTTSAKARDLQLQAMADSYNRRGNPAGVAVPPATSSLPSLGMQPLPTPAPALQPVPKLVPQVPMAAAPSSGETANGSKLVRSNIPLAPPLASGNNPPAALAKLGESSSIPLAPALPPSAAPEPFTSEMILPVGGSTAANEGASAVTRANLSGATEAGAFSGAGIVRRIKTSDDPRLEYAIFSPSGKLLAYLRPGVDVNLEPWVSHPVGLKGPRNLDETVHADVIDVESLQPVQLKASP